ncbi:alanine racemase [Anaerobium acetethylicum]|uniref:Diaminopimelate decarboxylase n=1 Tax=Anaerobium acetethylicum TaxID=1619234 RepID=A0A1D3TVP3_9FIRM|nr:alanine racemase [Anaerobium acetethylicum]SCP98229.1 diaminopimelate decarboxylase [Anaerobium acetethylicum]
MDDKILEKIAETQGTPAYVFNLDELSDRLEMIRKHLNGAAELCYAMKANPFLIGHMGGLVERFEVCSPGEYAICERAGIPASKIVLSGVNKEYGEIEGVVETAGGSTVYTIESEQHLQILAECSGKKKEMLPVLIRLTSGNQFGIDEKAVCSMLERWDTYPYLEFRGIQFYSGTQKKNAALMEKELKHLDAFCAELKERFQIEIPELEYGPGLCVSYFEKEEEDADREILESLAGMLKAMEFAGKITLEIGRYMAAHCGYYLTSIVDTKRNQDRNYCIIDGGINHISYHGQIMAMKVPPHSHIPQKPEGGTEKWNVCGSLCTVADVLVKELPLSGAGTGDLLIFKRIGAYSVTEGIYLFLSRNLPKVLFYSREGGVLVARDTQPTYTINSKS